MTAKRFTIVDEQFISYYGGTGHKISNGECGFWLWHSKEETQKVCDKLNSILDENEQLKQKIEYQQDIIVDAIDSLMDLPSITLYLMKQWLEACEEYDSIEDMKNTFSEKIKELEE